MSNQTPELQVLTKCLTQLCRQLDQVEVVVYLVSRGVLSNRQMEEIEAKESDFRKNRSFIQILMKSSNIKNAFKTFIEALKLSNQNYLANGLLEELKAAQMPKEQYQVSFETLNDFEMQPLSPNKRDSDSNNDQHDVPEMVPPNRPQHLPLSYNVNPMQNEPTHGPEEDYASDHSSCEQQHRSPTDSTSSSFSRKLAPKEKAVSLKVLNAASDALKLLYQKNHKIVNPFSTTPFEFNVKDSWTPLSLGLLSRLMGEDYEPINDHLQLIDRAFNNQKQLLIIQGIAGCGKTSLMYRLLHDWSIEELMSYKLVFYVSLCEIRNKKFATIADMIAACFQVASKDDINIARVISNLEIADFCIKNRMLVILDGYNEAYDEGSCAELSNFLKQYGISRRPLSFNIIITTRPGHFWQYLNRSGILSFAVVRGFESDEQKEDYLNRLATNKRDEIQQCIKQGGILPEIANTPLLMVSLCVILCDKDKLSITNFELYRTIIWLLIDRYQRDHPDDNVPLLFGYEADSEELFCEIIRYHFHEFPLLVKLGIMALALYPKYNFEKADLEAYGINMIATKNILIRVGLLTHEDNGKTWRSGTKLTFPHITLRFFLTGGAYYFWKEYTKESGSLAIFSESNELDDQFEMKDLKNFVKDALLRMEDSQIDLFLRNFTPAHTISLDLSLFTNAEHSENNTCNTQLLNKILSKCIDLKEIHLYYHLSNTIIIQHEISFMYNSSLRSLKINGKGTNEKSIRFEAADDKPENCYLKFVKLREMGLKNIEFRDIDFHNELCFNTTMSHMMKRARSCSLHNCGIYFREGKRIHYIKSVDSNCSISDDYDSKCCKCFKFNCLSHQKRKYEKYTTCLKYVSHSSRIILHAAESVSRRFHAKIPIPVFSHLKSLRLESFDFSCKKNCLKISPKTFPLLEVLEYSSCCFDREAIFEIVKDINSYESIVRIAFLSQSFQNETCFNEFLTLLQQFRSIRELEMQFQCIGPENSPPRSIDATAMFYNLAKKISNLTKLIIWKNDCGMSIIINEHRMAESFYRKGFVLDLQTQL